MMNSILQLAIAYIVSLMDVHWIFLKVLKVAKVKGLVENLDARKLQNTPVSVLGGVLLTSD